MTNYPNTSVTNPDNRIGDIEQTNDGEVKIVGWHEQGGDLIYECEYKEIEGTPTSPINAADLDN